MKYIIVLLSCLMMVGCGKYPQGSCVVTEFGEYYMIMDYNITNGIYTAKYIITTEYKEAKFLEDELKACKLD